MRDMKRTAKAALKSLDRREFLKQTAKSVAAAAVLPNIVPASILGLRGATAPSNRLALGCVGMGKQMGGHVNTFLRNSETQVVAMCDVESIRLGMHQSRANEFYANQLGQAAYNGVEAYKDFRELVSRPDIDAVVVATPDHWHALVAIAAMKSGKDVYCEKPLTLTIAEAQALVKAARRYGRVFQTGSQQRSSTEFLFACEMVRSGRIGKVHTVYVNVGGPSKDSWELPGQPVPEGLDWDMWLGPAPWRTYNYELAPDLNYRGWPNWRGYRDYSGGGMTDWGAHHFDIAQWGLGMDESGPVEVIPPDGGEHERLTYKYADGVAMYHGGGPGEAGVTFVGERGRVMVNRGYLETDPIAIMATPIGPNEVTLYRSKNHHQDWLDCIRSRKRPICDVDVGRHSIIVCHIGNIAYWLKRPLKWDPAAERFVNDDEANRMLARAMRSPWRIEEWV